jgi:LysM repeat protein
MDRILVLNGIQADWPLQIGQKLLIDPGNVTPSPTLSAIQQLTPDADGKYYHTIESGETLLGIARLYDVPLSDLMGWNRLDNNSIIYIDQKLILLITLPATPTLTPGPPTTTPSPSPSSTQSPPTVTLTATATVISASGSNQGLVLGVIVLFMVIGGLLWWRFSRRS